jgi:hypothetical protein
MGVFGDVIGLLVFLAVAYALAAVIRASLRPGPPSWLVIAAAAVLPLLAIGGGAKWLFA